MESALYLIPVTLGETDISQVLPSYNHDIIVQIKHFIVENIRSARRFLKKVDKSIDIDTLTFYELSEHTDARSPVMQHLLDPLVRGESMGVISEALNALKAENDALRSLLTTEGGYGLPASLSRVDALEYRYCGRPTILSTATAGAPSVEVVPDEWDEDTMGAWDGGASCPLGTRYIVRRNATDNPSVFGAVYEKVGRLATTAAWVLLAQQS